VNVEKIRPPLWFWATLTTGVHKIIPFRHLQHT